MAHFQSMEGESDGSKRSFARFQFSEPPVVFGNVGGIISFASLSVITMINAAA